MGFAQPLRVYFSSNLEIDNKYKESGRHQSLWNRFRFPSGDDIELTKIEPSPL